MSFIDDVSFLRWGSHLLRAALNLKISFRFKDVIQTKQVKEHLLPQITSISLILFPLHFHLAIDFFSSSSPIHFMTGTGL